MFVIAHRGSSAHCLENTMAAFERAVAAGADMIEMDVRLSRDREVVVFHDANLRRLYRKRQKISKVTFAHLEHITKGAVPRLADVLKQFRGKIKFYVEIKSERLRTKSRALLVERVCEEIAASGASKDCLVASFDYRVPALCRRLNPDAWTGFIFANRRSFLAAKARGLADVDVLCPHKRLLKPRFWEACKKTGKTVFVWVLDKNVEQRHARQLGVDGIVTNDPAPLLQRLAGG